MSSRIRFVTARNVFEAFPDLRQMAPPPADESPPLDYARRLLASPRCSLGSGRSGSLGRLGVLGFGQD